jgi:4-nitrophenyl phosphatase
MNDIEKTFPQVANRYRFILMDMDGVLYRGNQPLPGLIEFFDFLHQNNFRYRLLTNNATQSADSFRQKLLNMGVAVPPGTIITSAGATAAYLKRESPEGAGVFVVGMKDLREALFGPAESPSSLLYFDDKNPRYVVQGADFNLVYDTVKRATLLIRAGATFVVTNADPVYPSEEGLIPGAGSIGALLKTATGTNPLVIGKPEPPMYEMALAELLARPEETVMIGDNFLTDISGAQRLNIPTIMTLSGVTSPADYAASPTRATHAFLGLPELLADWKTNENK